jgi:hypothetical protein
MADFAPVISNVKAVYETVFGVAPITERELEAWELVFAGTEIISGPIGDSFKHGGRVIKHGDDLVDMAKGIDNGASVVKGIDNAIPNFNKATIDPRKLTDYNPNHPV